MSEFKDDTFLSRWINDELSEEELETFKNSKDYEVYSKIKDGSTLIESAAFDDDVILMKIKSEKSIGKKSNRRYLIPTAASVLLLCGFVIYSILFSSKLEVYQTGIGEKMIVELPDGSNVTLNANSLLSYSSRDWKQSRELILEGEAFFDVENGEKFTVHTKNGNVSVLGTQFSIQELKDFFEVLCFEGSVKVVSSEEVEILKPKSGVRRTNRSQLIKLAITETKPSWLDNKSTFRGVSMKYVFIELQNQYGIDFKGLELVNDQSFNGSFPHNDLDLALKLVLDPVNINYKKEGKTIVLSMN